MAESVLGDNAFFSGLVTLLEASPAVFLKGESARSHSHGQNTLGSGFPEVAAPRFRGFHPFHTFGCGWLG